MDNNSSNKPSFIHEYHPGNEVEPMDNAFVYHYTSPDSFLSIIQNNYVRFTDVRYMNDKSESIYIVKRMIEFAEQRKNDYPIFCKALNELIKSNNIDAIKNLTTEQIQFEDFTGLKVAKQRNFIFCTSMEADSLNMWNYYAFGGKYSGYNLGLSVQDFLKSFETESEKALDAFIVYHGKVIYKEKEQEIAIEELAKQVEIPISYDGTQRAIQRRAAFIRIFIETKGLFFKDSSFSSEKEYRFLLSIADKRIPHNREEAKKYVGKYNKKICEEFCVRNGVIVPYLKITIPPNSISRITMSPMIEYEIAKSSIKEILEVKQIKGNKFTEVPVYKSKIPIRF